MTDRREYFHDLEHEIAAMAAISEREGRSPEGKSARRRLKELYQIAASNRNAAQATGRNA